MAPATSQHPAVGSRAGRPELWEGAAREFAVWRAGEADALARLVRLLTPVLWQQARAYGLDRQAAEDVVQATWLALVRAADSVREPQAVLRWLTVTTRREAWRVAHRAHREYLTDRDVLDAAVPPVDGPEDGVLAEGAAGNLWRQVSRLSPRCRRLLRVIAFEDRPDYASLAGELGMQVGSIGPTRGRCLAKLCALLADDPEWGDRDESQSGGAGAEAAR